MVDELAAQQLAACVHIVSLVNCTLLYDLISLHYCKRKLHNENTNHDFILR